MIKNQKVSVYHSLWVYFIAVMITAAGPTLKAPTATTIVALFFCFVITSLWERLMFPSFLITAMVIVAFANAIPSVIQQLAPA